jgi:hypothetical protein
MLNAKRKTLRACCCIRSVLVFQALQTCSKPKYKTQNVERIFSKKMYLALSVRPFSFYNW